MSYEHIIEQFVPGEAYRETVGPDVLHVISRTRYHDSSRGPHEPQRLIALGSLHINDPEHWYYRPAMEIFYNWEEATRGSKRVLIAEGDQDLWGLGETPGHAISEHYSSVGLQCLLSEAYDIPIISGEPPNYSDIGQLMLEFPPEEVLLHYGIIQIPLLHRMQAIEKPSLDEYMEERMFPSYRRQLGKLALTLPDSHPLHEFNFSYSNFKNIYRAHFGDEPNAEDSELNEFYLKITSAHLESSEFADQPVARVAPRRRDLRYCSLAAVHADLWEELVSSFTWRGILHTMTLDDYFDQFGHSAPPSSSSWIVSSQTRSGFIAQKAPGPASYRPIPWWDFQPINCTEEEPFPPYLFNPNQPLSESIKEYSYLEVKAHFSKLTTESIGPSPYITHLTRPFDEWNSKFSATSRVLEALSDLVYPEFTTSISDDKQPEGLDNRDWRERRAGVLKSVRANALFLDQNDPSDDSLLAACLRLNVHFCHASSDYPLLNQHVLRLFEQFVVSAQDIRRAVMAFDTASKHLTGLFVPFPDHARLTPSENLHYCLTMLEYELRKRH